MFQCITLNPLYDTPAHATALLAARLMLNAITVRVQGTWYVLIFFLPFTAVIFSKADLPAATATRYFLFNL
jgi:hypothetical protein